METIKLLFYKADNSNPHRIKIDSIVAWYTKGQYSHVEIVYKEDELHWYTWSASGRDGRVRHKMLPKDYTRWDIAEVELKDGSKKLILDFFKSIDGEKYDWLGILGFILPTQDRSNRWFCSESCSNALKICGWKPMWKLDASNVSPNKLAKMCGLEVKPISFKDIINASWKKKHK